MWIIGVPYIRVRAEPEGYNLSDSISSKKFFCFKLRKKCCSKALLFKVGFSLSFSILEVSEIISSIVFSQSFRSKMTTPFPLSDFVKTRSLFYLRIYKTSR